MSDMSAIDLEFYQKLLMERSGLDLSSEKTYLLQSRLTPVAQSLGFSGLLDFTEILKMSKDEVMIKAVIEAMTTNETSFFRDTKPFDMLKKIVPEIMEKKTIKKIRIWSAACSSGQEAYSIAIIMDELCEQNPGWQYQIMGTDISQDMVNRARKGAYNQFEIQRGLTIQMMVKYFSQQGGVWHIQESLKRNVDFQFANFLDNLTHVGTFDIVFCRNVLIYFNSETKERVLGKIAGQLNSNGMLFLGACEAMMGLNVPFEPVPERHGVHRLKSSMPLAAAK